MIYLNTSNGLYSFLAVYTKIVVFYTSWRLIYNKKNILNKNIKKQIFYE